MMKLLKMIIPHQFFYEDPSEKGITISAEEGELLMTHHILNIDPILEDDWYHKRIFRTHGTVIKYVMSSLMVEVVRMWCLKLWWRNLHL